MIFVLHFFILYSFVVFFGQAAEDCQWKYHEERKDESVEVFWINLDKSVSRRIAMEDHLNHLGILHRRVRGLSLDDLYIPEDILTTWNQYEAQINTKDVIPLTFIPPSIADQSKAAGRNTNSNSANNGGTGSGSGRVNVSYAITGLVGRAKTNRLQELGCTASHLEAMRQAVYNNRTTSPYAIITEDDIFFPFQINFTALALTAPKDFTILQLFNSNEGSMISLWKDYLTHGEKKLWIEHRIKQAISFWSTCAYLIHRDRIRPILEKIAFIDHIPHPTIEDKKNSHKIVNFKIVAGIAKPCRPKLTSCCLAQPASQTYQFQHQPPCVWAPKGFQADSFLYALDKTYVLSLPLITNGEGGNESTFHQDHVESIHHAAFQRQRGYINELIHQQVPLPSFVTLACQKSLVQSMELHKRESCSLPYYLREPAGHSGHHHAVVSIPFHGIETLWRGRTIPIQHVNKTIFPFFQSHSWVRREMIHIPSDIIETWEGKNCQFHSREFSSLDHIQKLALWNEGIRFVISGLCGRSRANSLEDLPRLLSHLITLYDIIDKQNLLVVPDTSTDAAGTANSATTSSSRASSKYAIISEGGGDLYSPFIIDFTQLIASAPNDFVFLRLFLGDKDVMESYWRGYVSNYSSYWRHHADRVYDELAPKLYIVNLERLSPRLQHIIVKHELNTTATLYDMKIIAGLKSPCIPTQCCLSHDTTTTTTNSQEDGRGRGSGENRKNACLVNPTGFQAERFLWKLGPTYTFTLPLFTAEMSHHQQKTPQMIEIFASHRRFMNEIITEHTPKPFFIKSRCGQHLPLAALA